MAAMLTERPPLAQVRPPDGNGNRRLSQPGRSLARPSSVGVRMQRKGGGSLADFLVHDEDEREYE